MQRGSGCTALYLAAEAGDQAIVHLLLVAGANAALAASDGGTPVMCACNFGHERCARELIKAGAAVEQTEEEFAQIGGNLAFLTFAVVVRECGPNFVDMYLFHPKYI